MVNIWNPDYAGNPDNVFYVSSARLVDIDWKKFRRMYDGLDEEVRKEFDHYLMGLMSREVHRETQEFLDYLDRVENMPSERLIKVKYASCFAF